jgi:uncharacterized protein YqgV (UPF0045/DUF77 family)
MEDMQKNSSRVYLTLKVDWRDEPAGRLKRKIDSVLEKMQA